MRQIPILTDEDIEEQEGRIRRTLNRLYWAFFIIALTIASYMVGWVVAYTSSCVCKG